MYLYYLDRKGYDLFTCLCIKMIVRKYLSEDLFMFILSRHGQLQLSKPTERPFVNNRLQLKPFLTCDFWSKHPNTALFGWLLPFWCKHKSGVSRSNINASQKLTRGFCNFKKDPSHIRRPGKLPLAGRPPSRIHPFNNE